MSTCWLQYMEAVKVLFYDLVQKFSLWIPRKRAETHAMSRDFWMPDQSCRVCYECDTPFSLFNRRHHCRICGRVFCWKCTQHTLPIVPDGVEEWQGSERVRACNFCFKLKQAEQRQIAEDKIVAKPSSPPTTPSSSNFSLSSSSTNTSRNSISSSSSSSSSASGNVRQIPLPYGFRTSMTEKIEPIAERQRPRRRHGRRSRRTESPRGRDLSPNPYDFMGNRSEDDDDESTDQAKEGFYGPGRAFDSQSQEEEECDSCLETDLMEVSLIHNVKYLDQVAEINGHNRSENAIAMTDNSSDIDRSLSRRSMLSCDDYEESVDESNLYTHSLVSGPTAAAREELIDLEENTSVWVPPPPEDYEDEMALTMVYDDDDEEEGRGWGRFSNSEYRIHEKANALQEQRRAMRAAVDGHFRTLVGQLLGGEGLDIDENDTDNWLRIVADLALQAASYIKPDTSKGGGMDPGGYVKVKCIATGKRSDSCVVKGVVCKRNVAHRRMNSHYKNPRLLLIGGSLEYQRVPNQLSSLDTLLQQEKEHLSMTVSRIEAHRPNVILVEKTISRQAQEKLLAKDISFVLNVKRSLLERIARCTGAEIVPSPDHLLKATSGHCDSFHVDKIEEELGSSETAKNSTKTLMFFEGCPRPLGCTVVLKGATGGELQKVKRVVQFAVFAAYQLALETSFLVDEGATVPELTFKSPISVALPDKPLKSDRSITTVPGFLLPTSGHMQITDSQTAQNNNGNLVADFPSWSMTSSCVSSRNNSPGTSPRASFRGFSTNQPSYENLDAAFMAIRHPNHDVMYNRSIGYQNSAHGQMRNLSRTSSSILMFAEKESFKETQSNVKVELEGVPELVTSAEAQNGSLLGGRDGSREDFPPSPSDHHSILVSFSSSCLEKRRVCERCLLYRIKYYGSFDKPLGKFLKDDVFDPSKKCAVCELSRDAHIHCYMHRQGSLVISVRQHMETLTGANDGKIWMWHRCLKCKSVNNVPPATHRVLMSDAAWGLSFGKFLELSFSNHAAASRLAACGHSLHRDCLRFYGFGSMVACFRYASINVHTVLLPPSKLIFNIPELNDWLSAEVQEITDNGTLLFAKAFNTLREIEEKIAIFGNGKVPEVRKRIAEYEMSLRRDQDAFLETLQKAVNVQSNSGCLSADILELNSIKRSLATLYHVWWDHFLQLLSLPRLLKAVPIGRSTTLADTSSLIYINDVLESKNLSDAFEHAALPQASEVISHEVSSSLTGTGSLLKNVATEQIECSDEKSRPQDDLDIPDSSQDDEIPLLPKKLDVETNGMQTTSEVANLEEKSPSGNLTEVADVYHLEDKPSFYNNIVDADPLVKRTMSEGIFVIPDLSYTFEAAWTGKVHTIEAHAVNITSSGQEILLQSSGIGSSTSVDEFANVHPGPDADASVDGAAVGQDAISLTDSPVKSTPKLDDSGASVGTPFSILYRSYNKNSQFLLNATPQSRWLHSSYSIKLEGKLFLPLGINDTVIPVYNEEPTSIIAYAITSHQYQAHLMDQPSDSERENELKRDRSRRKYLEFLTADSILPHPLQSSDNFSESGEFTSKDSNNYMEESGPRESGNLQNSKTVHVKVSFSDDEPEGNVKYTVTCYFARQFDALRRTCCPDQVDFIRSLCHCKNWSAQGGKSNVFFAKTKDERFVIKQVTKTELESFIKFAPEYFKYLSESLKTGSPTCLAKILGIFQVTVKNGKGVKDVRMDVMVMENLLYGRQVSRLYDLKGSTRSRYNADTTGTNKVLLDENLLESMLTNPIFIGNKAKRILERAVWNDTAFLASIDVMDYSLLVGVDEERKQLVVGIIDFMRQYTWDKHLETWVKASGILGGPKNTAPTVISPKQYKKRFRKAMKGYFLMVPDQWSPATETFAPSHVNSGENLQSNI